MISARIAIKGGAGAAGVEPGQVSEVIMGQILTAAQGQTRPARPRLRPAFRWKARPGRQPALRLRPAHGGARLSGRCSRRFSVVVARAAER